MYNRSVELMVAKCPKQGRAGKIIFLSLSISNKTQRYSEYKYAARSCRHGKLWDLELFDRLNANLEVENLCPCSLLLMESYGGRNEFDCRIRVWRYIDHHQTRVVLVAHRT